MQAKPIIELQIVNTGKSLRFVQNLILLVCIEEMKNFLKMKMKNKLVMAHQVVSMFFPLQDQEDGNGHAMIVPVWVRPEGELSNAILQYAVPDDQSNVGFVCKSLYDKLHVNLQGQPTELLLTTVHERNAKVQSNKVCGLEILDFHQEHQSLLIFDLFNLYRVPKPGFCQFKSNQTMSTQKCKHLTFSAEKCKIPKINSTNNSNSLFLSGIKLEADPQVRYLDDYFNNKRSNYCLCLRLQCHLMQ